MFKPLVGYVRVGANRGADGAGGVNVYKMRVKSTLKSYKRVVLAPVVETHAYTGRDSG